MSDLIHWRRSASFALLLLFAVLFLTFRSSGETSQTAITGELVETYCWGKVRVGGPSHAQCAIQCAKRGIPVAVIEANTRKDFVLLPGKHEATLSPKLIAAMGRNVTIRGELLKRGQNHYLTADSWTIN
jgi:hypothetical protein